MKKKPEFRFAFPEDTGKILFFIKNLARYEKLEDEVVATEELLREWIFEKKKAEVLFALEDGKEVGFALFFTTFPHFLAEPESIWKICLFFRNIAAEAMEKGFLESWPGLR